MTEKSLDRRARRRQAAARGIDPMGTHMPVLLAACLATNGPLVEIGGGLFSTPLLHGFSFTRPVLTIETEPDWHAKIECWENQNHKVVLARRWSQVERHVRKFCEQCEASGQTGREFPVGVMFVDGDRDQRLPAIQLGRTIADYVVAHDYEAKLSYRYGAACARWRSTKRSSRPRRSVLRAAGLGLIGCWICSRPPIQINLSIGIEKLFVVAYSSSVRSADRFGRVRTAKPIFPANEVSRLLAARF